MIQHQPRALKVLVAAGKVHGEAECVFRLHRERGWTLPRLAEGGVRGREHVLCVCGEGLLRGPRVERGGGEGVVVRGGLVGVVFELPEHEGRRLGLVRGVVEAAGQSGHFEGRRQEIRVVRAVGFGPPDEAFGALVAGAVDGEDADIGEVSPLAQEPVPAAGIVIPLVVPHHHHLVLALLPDHDQVRHHPADVLQHRRRNALHLPPRLDLPHAHAAVQARGL